MIEYQIGLLPDDRNPYMIIVTREPIPYNGTYWVCLHGNCVEAIIEAIGTRTGRTTYSIPEGAIIFDHSPADPPYVPPS